MALTLAALGLNVATAASAGQRVVPTIVSSPTKANPVTQTASSHAKRVGRAKLDLSGLRFHSARRGSSTPSPRPEAYIAPNLHFELFPGVAFDAKGVRIEQEEFGSTSWVGHIAGAKNSQVIVTTDGQTVVGRVDWGMSSYTFRGDEANGVTVKEIDYSSFKSDNDKTYSYLTDIARSPYSTKPYYMLNGTGSSDTIDVLVLYSQHACFQMGCLNPSPFVANLIADNNQAYLSSSVDGAARVVGYEMISGYTEPLVSEGDAYAEFSALLQNMISGNGYFSDVPDLRDAYHADVAVLFVDGTRITDGPCGVTKTMKTGVSNDNTAFVVLSTSCAIGDRTLTHEIGHVLSGRHDTDIGPLSGNPYTDDFGYSSASPSFHTIMGSNNDVGGVCNQFDGCPRINRWSSLTQTYGGAALGETVNSNGTIYSSDLVTVLDTTVPIVAGYRTASGLSSPGTPGTPISYDCSDLTHVQWAPASGTVGWYEADKSASSSFSVHYQVYKGAGTAFSAHFNTSQYIRVRACNASGCGAYATTFVGPTGPNCEVMP